MFVKNTILFRTSKIKKVVLLSQNGFSIYSTRGKKIGSVACSKSQRRFGAAFCGYAAGLMIIVQVDFKNFSYEVESC